MPYWEDLEYNDADEIDGPGDVSLPLTMHHTQVRAELRLLVKAGAITDTEADSLRRQWHARSELGDEDRVAAAVKELRDRGLIDEETGDELLEKAGA